jgi:hypothetical protein
MTRTYPVACGPSMDRQTTLLLALGMLIAAAFVVGVAGWVLFARDHALHKTLVNRRAPDPVPADGTRHADTVDDPHHEVAEGS